MKTIDQQITPEQAIEIQELGRMSDEAIAEMRAFANLINEDGRYIPDVLVEMVILKINMHSRSLEAGKIDCNVANSISDIADSMDDSIERYVLKYKNEAAS